VYKKHIACKCEKIVNFATHLSIVFVSKYSSFSAVPLKLKNFLFTFALLNYAYITVTNHMHYTGYFLKLFSFLEKILLELNHLSVRKIKQTVEISKKKRELYFDISFMNLHVYLSFRQAFGYNFNSLVLAVFALI